MFMFYTFMLNKSKQTDTISKMIDFIIEKVDEEKLGQMHHNRSALIARQLFLFNSFQGENANPKYVEYQQMCHRVNVGLIKKVNESKQAKAENDINKVIAKENIYIRKALN